MQTALVRFIREELITVVALGTAVLVSAVLVGRLGLPRIADAWGKQHAVRQCDSLLTETGDYAALRASLTSVNDSLTARLAAISADMSDASNLSGLLEMLIDRARKADISFVRMQPTAQVDTGKCTTYPVLLEFTTSYNALGRFVAGLEAQPNVARVDRLAIVGKDSHEADVKLLVTVFLRSTKGGT